MIQLQFLNKLLDTKNISIITSNSIGKEFFSDYKEEWNFIKNHIDNYGNIPDKETFISKFPNFDIIQVNENSDYLLDELYKDFNQRKLAETFNQVRNYLNNGEVEKAVNLYTSSAQNVLTAKHINSIDIIHDTSRYDRYIERTEDYTKYYVKTGFKELDEIIGGWDRQEELATIAARPGVGKSWILLKTAIAAAEQGLNVGIYSGEMSENKVGYRIDTLLSHISNGSIIHGNVRIQNDYKKYLEELPNKLKGSIKILTPAMIGGFATASDLRAFIEKDNLDMLCVDQHSLLEDEKGARNAVDKANNISRSLKNLQVLKKIPIIAVSQQNREKAEEGASTSNIAQSDRISQDTTFLMFLEQKDNILTLSIAKNRDGANGGKLKYSINLDKGIFEYIPNEKDATNGSKCEELEQEYEYEDDTEEACF